MAVTEIKHKQGYLPIEYDPDPNDIKHPLRILITCPVGRKLIELNRAPFDIVGNYYPYIGQCQGCNTLNIRSFGILNNMNNSNPDLTPKLVVTTLLTTQSKFCNNSSDEDLQLA